MVPVLLFHQDDPVKAVKVYVLLDNVSDMTFITTQVQRELGVVGVETCLDLSTILGSERLTVKKVDGLVVQRLDKHAQVQLPKAHIKETIPSRRDQIPRPEIVKNWPRLKRIQERIAPYEMRMLKSAYLSVVTVQGRLNRQKL